MSRTRNKANATGRTPNSRFARLEHRLLETPAYRALSPNARALLIEIVMLHNGSNNGRIFLSRKDAAARIGVSDEKAAGAAFLELEALGLTVMTRDASFRMKAGDGPRARWWRLTFEPVTNRSGPTHDYLTLEPAPQTRARKRMDAGLKALKKHRKTASQIKSPGEDSPFLPPKEALTAPTPGEDSSSANLENNAIQPIIKEGESPYYTATSATVRSLRNPNTLPAPETVTTPAAQCWFRNADCRTFDDMIEAHSNAMARPVIQSIPESMAA
jgi:hypothetical protein